MYVAHAMTNKPKEPPATRIFLRNEFELKPGSGPIFLGASSGQLAFAKERGISLIASCSSASFDLERDSQEPPPTMMNIWEMPRWDSLFGAMCDSNETDWVRHHQASVTQEDQQLLVDLRLALGTEPPVLSKYTKVYLYEKIQLRGRHIPLEFRQRLLKFARAAKELPRSWSWVWSTTQVTSQPGVLYLLWSAESTSALEEGLSLLREKPWYPEMMTYVSSLTRRYMFPTKVELLASSSFTPKSALQPVRNRKK